MATPEELQAKINNLEDQLKQTKEKCSELESKGKTHVHVTRERRFDKYSGSDNEDLQEWSSRIKTYVDGHFDKNETKAEFIFDHLDGAAKAEVKFCSTSNKSSPQEIFDILDQVFGSKETLTQLQQRFFGCNQGAGESIRDYSYKLMDLLGAINEKQPHLYADKDTVLKQKLADGVESSGLRRELRRLNSERTELKFWELRDKAILWLEEENSLNRGVQRWTNETATCETTSAGGWKELFQKQQEQLEMLTKMVSTLGTRQLEAEKTASANKPNSQWKNKFPRNDGQQQRKSVNKDGTLYCHYCKGPNHLAKNCLLKRKDRQESGAKYAKEGNESTNSTN